MTASSSFFASAMAQAQTSWPSKALRLVVPFTPGGTTDYVTRLMGIELAKALGQPVVVENKPGAGTVIGVDSVAKSAADGYSFVTVANSFAANQTLVKKLSDLKALTATAADKISYASFGNGTSAHLSGAALAQQMGMNWVHVPYKGQAPALSDLLGGQVTLMFGNWPEFRSHVQSGKLVALGMATSKRSVYAPDIPTLAEQGVPLESNSWNGLLAPANTPDAIVERLNAEVNKALMAHAVLEAFLKGGIASLSGTPDKFAQFLKSEIDKYAQVVRKANITLDA
ncbi:MAG: tripartite tricarboxylate transporter substrate binding protein [Betaproteobacteria bacterium]|nr:tripartite tricarboxylate transporter substrate binding protein [Betaproteobacteria bacterium]